MNGNRRLRNRKETKKKKSVSELSGAFTLHHRRGLPIPNGMK
jgi:hypothetical protein